MGERLINIENLTTRLVMLPAATVVGIISRFRPSYQEGLAELAYEMNSKYGRDGSLYPELVAIFLPMKGREKIREAARAGLEAYRRRYSEDLAWSAIQEVRGEQNG